MKVAELIAKLQATPQDAEVCFHVHGGVNLVYAETIYSVTEGRRSKAPPNRFTHRPDEPWGDAEPCVLISDMSKIL